MERTISVQSDGELQGGLSAGSRCSAPDVPGLSSTAALRWWNCSWSWGGTFVGIVMIHRGQRFRERERLRGSGPRPITDR
ncbi:unnamed protein product [Heligmosomoides polygyrus]|uniref:Uncharacterized protein n=1 Tax=Heligmosomoides polygyrus TaxID=6339 RepID=A0A183FHU7_HELPZ|nr:unnamed protein product [Heligmosomoides polygyrus]